MMLSASLWRMTSTPTWQDEIELEDEWPPCVAPFVAWGTTRTILMTLCDSLLLTLPAPSSVSRQGQHCTLIQPSQGGWMGGQ